MSDTAGNTVSLLRNAIIDAMGRAMSAGELPLAPTPNFTIETPADRTNGDLASNVAMVSARAFKKAPRAIAEAITKYIELEGTNLDRFEIAVLDLSISFTASNSIHQSSEKLKKKVLITARAISVKASVYL